MYTLFVFIVEYYKRYCAFRAVYMGNNIVGCLNKFLLALTSRKLFIFCFRLALSVVAVLSLFLSLIIGAVYFFFFRTNCLLIISYFVGFGQQRSFVFISFFPSLFFRPISTYYLFLTRQFASGILIHAGFTLLETTLSYQLLCNYLWSMYPYTVS